MPVTISRCVYRLNIKQRHKVAYRAWILLRDGFNLAMQLIHSIRYKHCYLCNITWPFLEAIESKCMLLYYYYNTRCMLWRATNYCCLKSTITAHNYGNYTVYSIQLRILFSIQYNSPSTTVGFAMVSLINTYKDQNKNKI